MRDKEDYVHEAQIRESTVVDVPDPREETTKIITVEEPRKSAFRPTLPFEAFIDRRQRDQYRELKAELCGKDPSGLDQHAPGAKLDAGKPDLSLLLLFGKALQSVAAVGTYGARKYTRGGWQEVDDGVNRYTAALLRHLTQENAERNDKESGFAHASHVAWNALARLELMIRESEKKHEV